jgi:alpha-tubulin suppressor-like RCC1 family protein
MVFMKLMSYALAIALLTPAAAVAQTAPLIRDIAAGSGFTLVVKADGTVVGWGRDPNGEAARPVSPNRFIPAPVVIAWGSNDAGQLGNGPMGASSEPGRYPKPSVTPVPVTGLKDIIQIEAGSKHAVALRKDGTVWAWGTRNEGAIGDGAPKTLHPAIAISPTQVPGLQGVKQIAAAR